MPADKSEDKSCSWERLEKLQGLGALGTQVEGDDRRPDMSSSNSCRGWHAAEGVWEAEGGRSDGRGRNQGDVRAAPLWNVRASLNVGVINRSKGRRRMGFFSRGFHCDRIVPTKMKDHWIPLS